MGKQAASGDAAGPSGAKDLTGLRRDIEKTDQDLMAAFSRRMALSRQIAGAKARTGATVYDPRREDEVVRLALTHVEPADAVRAENLLRSLMRLSRGAQYEALLASGQDFELGNRIAAAPRAMPALNQIAYQGSGGSYAALACQQLFPGVPLQPVLTWENACRLVLDGTAELAVLPLENSTAGTVDDVYDLLAKYDLHIWRSLSLAIDHCLLGLPGAAMGNIHTVVSHPQALAQCSDLIRQRGWSVLESPNTAFAADMVSRQADPGLAAIASVSAAADSQLQVLQRGISNSHINQTRFIAIGRPLLITPDADRISLLLRLPHRSGSLAATLAVFSDHGLNLNKIQSRPDLDNPWTYLFYLDFECPVDRLPAALAVLCQLSREMPLIRLLGWYSEE